MINQSSSLEYNREVFDSFCTVCEPLFRYLKIKYFRYMRLFDNGQYLSLSNNISYMEQYLEHIEKLGSVFRSVVSSAPETDYYIFLWPNNPSAPLAKKDNVFSLMHSFNIWNGISFYKRKEDFVEAWNFAGNPNDCYLPEFYINHIPTLKHFIQYFQENAAPLIDCSDKKKLSIFKNHVGIYKPNGDDLERKLAVADFLKATPLTHYIKGIHGVTPLPKRYVDCLNLLSCGKTTKEIANSLGLRYKTVAGYIEKIKNKTGYNFKSELINAWQKTIL